MRRLAASLALLLAAGLGPVACGGGGEDTTSNPTQEGRAQAQAAAEAKAGRAEVQREYEERRAAEAPTPDEREAEEAAAGFYAILGGDEAGEGSDRPAIDTVSFCELMSEEARAQTVHYAKVSSGVEKEWSCESAVELLVLRAKRTGGFEAVQEAEVIGVNAQGDRATATVRFGKGPATAIPLVREDGEWKLAASSIGAGR